MSVKTCESCVRLCVFSKFQTKVTFSFLLFFFLVLGVNLADGFVFPGVKIAFTLIQIF